MYKACRRRLQQIWSPIHCSQSKELLRDLERLLQLSCESARMTCAHMEAMAGGLYELGRNMGMLSKFEEAVQAKSGQYTQVRTCGVGKTFRLVWPWVGQVHTCCEVCRVSL